eukprot:2219781-Amphidinium_carterae.1
MALVRRESRASCRGPHEQMRSQTSFPSAFGCRRCCPCTLDVVAAHVTLQRENLKFTIERCFA